MERLHSFTIITISSIVSKLAGDGTVLLIAICLCGFCLLPSKRAIKRFLHMFRKPKQEEKVHNYPHYFR